MNVPVGCEVEIVVDVVKDKYKREIISFTFLIITTHREHENHRITATDVVL